MYYYLLLSGVSPREDRIDGKFAGGYVSFGTASAETRVVEMRVAISFISIEQARANLAAEKEMTFDSARSNAQKLWDNILSKVRIDDRV